MLLSGIRRTQWFDGNRPLGQWWTIYICWSKYKMCPKCKIRFLFSIGFYVNLLKLQKFWITSNRKYAISQQICWYCKKQNLFYVFFSNFYRNWKKCASNKNCDVFHWLVSVRDKKQLFSIIIILIILKFNLLILVIRYL